MYTMVLAGLRYTLGAVPEDRERDEPESFVWSVLKPADWNRDVHLGWRFDAAQLAKEHA